MGAGLATALRRRAVRIRPEGLAEVEALDWARMEAVARWEAAPSPVTRREMRAARRAYLRANQAALGHAVTDARAARA